MVFPDVYKPRRQSVAVDIDGITVGGANAIAVQSMTNTDTADVSATTEQILDLIPKRPGKLVAEESGYAFDDAFDLVDIETSLFFELLDELFHVDSSLGVGLPGV